MESPPLCPDVCCTWGQCSLKSIGALHFAAGIALLWAAILRRLPLQNWSWALHCSCQRDVEVWGQPQDGMEQPEPLQTLQVGFCNKRSWFLHPAKHGCSCGKNPPLCSCNDHVPGFQGASPPGAMQRCLIPFALDRAAQWCLLLPAPSHCGQAPIIASWNH